jgi:hypothetical protein
VDGLNISEWEVAMAWGRRILSEKIEDCMRNGMRKRRKMATVERNNLGFDLSVLFIGDGIEWGINGH